MIRIVAPDGAYDYQNKYFTDVVQYLCPSGLPADEEGRDPAHRARRVPHARLPRLGPRRPDGPRRRDRRPFLLEMNTSPGMTGHSLVPMSAKAAGISYEQLCVQLLAALGELGRHRRGRDALNAMAAASIAPMAPCRPTSG